MVVNRATLKSTVRSWRSCCNVTGCCRLCFCAVMQHLMGCGIISLDVFIRKCMKRKPTPEHLSASLTHRFSLCGHQEAEWRNLIKTTALAVAAKLSVCDKTLQINLNYNSGKSWCTSLQVMLGKSSVFSKCIFHISKYDLLYNRWLFNEWNKILEFRFQTQAWKLLLPNLWFLIFMLKCYADYLFNIVITFCVKYKDAGHVCV